MPAAASAGPVTSTGGPAGVRGPAGPGLAVPGLAEPGIARALMPADAGPFSQLSGVFCTSAANCWAVGSYESKGATLNQVVQWNGRKWFRVPVPDPGGTNSGDLSDLLAVRCTSAVDCWAVGGYDKAGLELDQALHWNGRKWFLTATPTPAGGAGEANELFDVACTSASSCWAAGLSGTFVAIVETPGVSQGLADQLLYWNGDKWSLVPAPNPGGTGQNHVNVLDAVRCASAGDCWAAGVAGHIGAKGSLHLANDMLRWNGKKWSHIFVPSPRLNKTGGFAELNGLSCTSATSCEAAGAYGNRTSTSEWTSLNEVLRWNGKKWLMAATPNPDGTATGDNNGLLAVNCSSADNCWATGGAGGNFFFEETALNQALHWNGKKWSQVTTPEPAGTSAMVTHMLDAVRCTSADNCWAVGDVMTSGGAERNQLLHWNGGKWTAR